MEFVDCLKGSAAESFVALVKFNLNSIKKTFAEIGFRLNEANRLKYYEELGYESIEALSEKEFGFKRSSTYNLIGIGAYFCDGIKLAEAYEGYSYSQLCVMAKMERIGISSLLVCSSKYSVAQFEEYYNNQKNVRVHPDMRLKMKDYFERVAPLVQTSGLELEESKGQLKGQVSLDSVICKNDPAPVVPSVEKVEERKEKSVQTSGLKVEDFISCEELTEVIAEMFSTFDICAHVPTDNGFFLKVVPSAFAANLYYCLGKFFKKECDFQNKKSENNEFPRIPYAGSVVPTKKS